MIQRVFFDLGLTLAESDVPQGYVEHLARLGHPVSLEEAQRAYHLANKFFMRERQGALGKGSKEVLRDFLARVCQELGIPQLAHIRVKAGAVETVQLLIQLCKIGVSLAAAAQQGGNEGVDRRRFLPEGHDKADGKAIGFKPVIFHRDQL